MDSKTLTESLAAFDPEIYGLMQEEIHRQRFMLSLLPTSNAVSPFSAYLKGSIFGNGYMSEPDLESNARLERIAAARAEKLFGADHAVVRVGNLAAASRVVFFALAKAGDTILTFNGRKSEHCTGDALSFKFVSFGVEVDTEAISLERVAKLAEEHKPRLLIYSPVSYPRQVDFKRLAEIAHGAGAHLWVDIGQNVGPVAAGVSPTPVPYADVVTFSTNDSLHGPQGAVILTTKELADLMDKTVIETGHATVKKNVLAALSTVFLEARSTAFIACCEAVLQNAQALQKGLHESGIKTLCGDTQNHLVLALAPEGMSALEAENLLKDAGFLVKADTFKAEGSEKSYETLRLSSLDPTTRGLKAPAMEAIGCLIGDLLLAGEKNVRKTRIQTSALLMDKPLFSEEWLPSRIALTDGYGKSDLSIVHEAEKEQAIQQRVLSFWDN